MCRIFGYIGHDDVDPGRLKAVSDQQLAGGPDQQSVWAERNWAIGNNRLAIVGLDGGEQPYSLGDSIRIVLNGEIYNHRELRSKLEAKGYTFTDHCDGSILPALYAEYGQDFVRYLDGMFAIAVIDLREGVVLTLATDPSGIKSLYYYWDERNKTLYFSSELPSLLAFGSVPSSLWLPGVDFYLTTKVVFGERTLFDGVYALPPSSLLQARLGERPALRRWKTLLVSEPLGGDFHSAASSLRGQLDREVQALLLADVPVSSINSGGLDSSLITALASQRQAGIHSFNLSYVGDWPLDEKIYARQVSERYGTTHHEVLVDPRDFEKLLPLVAERLGQPNADPITLSSYALFEAIHQAGFKVTISGDGADEMFAGYDRFLEASEATDNWIKPYVASLGVASPELRKELYSDDYRAFIHDNGSIGDQISDSLRTAHHRKGRLDAILDFEREYRLPSYHLRRVDHLSMAHSVEVRVPYCQPRILDLAGKLPVDWRIGEGKVKRLLYRAAEGQLPDAILNRKKQPFTLPIDAMMRKGLPLYEAVERVLDRDTLRRHNLFSPAAVEKLLHKQATQPDGKTALTLWSLVIFQLWISQYQVQIGSSKQYQFEG
ncbi:asparagine synthase (glutamine-hydrolyzing) [Paenibacillus radicis (ex Gao et al. 2016)]|uniref:asparagine synthase (glutamine-hydrolyzing) n=1 Tax=Paenibacillus radicis (ex Gao et al. 2016) TaxID=1737354 RepID=A0A917H2S0_9BACL|nr:asparagine synthase (glutamine-hydrolyzing) [Paenibacillus radicis (ex Gao et al. 2016)]GGG65594.1 asparagine synthetase B [Paenibacillus radicis (ex Gao et al. 2016)]